MPKTKTNKRSVFITVGGHMPFDRLISCVDEWASTKDDLDFLAQIGPGDYTPRHMNWERNLSPIEYESRMKSSDLVIAHAGMGTIISALRFSVPMILMPRLARLNEMRNDHQVDTAERFDQLGLVEICPDQEHLARKLRSFEFDTQGSHRLGPHASKTLLDRISNFIGEKNQ